eukprot:SAG31_NODE_4775_length_2962_cov_26.328676_2_plen_30_part_00
MFGILIIKLLINRIPLRMATAGQNLLHRD